MQGEAAGEWFSQFSQERLTAEETNACDLPTLAAASITKPRLAKTPTKKPRFVEAPIAVLVSLYGGVSGALNKIGMANQFQDAPDKQTHRRTRGGPI